MPVKSKFAKPLAALTLIASLGVSQAAPAVRGALDWTTFSVELLTLGDAPASLSWDDASKRSYAFVQTPDATTHWTFDWTSPLNVHLDGPVPGTYAAADVSGSNVLSSTLVTLPSLVNMNRYGSFTLSAHTQVTFSIKSMLSYVDDGSPWQGDSAGAWTEFQLAFSPAEFVQTTRSLMAVGPQSDDTQTLSYANNADEAVSWTLYASANAFIGAAPVPEPTPAVMLLAGVAALAWVMQRRLK